MCTGKSDCKYFDVWATAWGPMGAAATDAGVCHVELPHYQMQDLVDLLKWRHKEALRTSDPFEQLISLSRDYFNAKAVSFADIPCVLPAEGTLGGLVLRACREIAYCQTRSYSWLAEKIGRPDAARAVAAALGKNKIPLVVPCHRVTYAGGGAGGFSAAGGPELKERLLALERANRSPAEFP